MSILWKSLVLLLSLIHLVPAIEFVHIRSGRFGQLVTSNTLRWAKSSHSKDPVTVPKKPDGHSQLCHLATGQRNIGLVNADSQCVVLGQDGLEEISSSFQTLSGHAAKVVWEEWSRPYPPPTGAVALSQNPNRFIAYSRTTEEVGYLDTKANLGSCIFSSGVQSQCEILTEVEPVRYQLSDVELKKSKGFIEEPIILSSATLVYIPLEEGDEENEESHLVKSRTEQVLSYQVNSFDYWGSGSLMSKGLHTSIKLNPRRSKVTTDKIIEWGLPSASSGKVETVPVWEDLVQGTGVNVTIRGTHRKGDMTYWAILKTYFKDGSYATRHIEGQRKVDEIQDIVVEKSKLFYLSDGSIVVTESTTLPTTSTQLSGVVLNPSTGEEVEQHDMTSSSHQPPNNNDLNLQTSNLMLNSKATNWSSDNGFRVFSIAIIFHTLLQRVL